MVILAPPCDETGITPLTPAAVLVSHIDCMVCKLSCEPIEPYGPGEDNSQNKCQVT